MKLIITLANLSQFHQIVLVSVVASLITNLIKIKVKNKPDVIYQLIALGLYVILELMTDIIIMSVLFVPLSVANFLQEILTLISGIALTYMLYDTYHKLIKNIREFRNGKKEA